MCLACELEALWYGEVKADAPPASALGPADRPPPAAGDPPGAAAKADGGTRLPASGGTAGLGASPQRPFFCEKAQ